MKISAHTCLKTIVSMSLLASLAACNPSGEPVARNSAERPAAAPVICNDCGTINSIEETKVKGDASGVGAVIGAVAGAAIGHQVGDGQGQDAATATGAIGGGIAGHQIERRIKGTPLFHVTVAMENGGTRTVDIGALNGLSVGSKVKVVGNSLQAAG
jgi:outer membrane lipoprotein SlyB